MSKVSVKEAAFLTGKSRETINNATNEGILSCSRNAKQHKVIDISELERVYPLVQSMDALSKEIQPVQNGPAESASVQSDNQAQIQILQQKLESSERMREVIVDERERERKQLESEIENLRISINKVQDQHSKAMLMITDQSQSISREERWENTLQSLEARLANQEKRSEKEREEIKEQAKRQIERHRRALEEEKSKSLWQKLVG